MNFHLIFIALQFLLANADDQSLHPIPTATNLECIDTQDDFNSYGWTASHAVTLQYAPTGADLPEPFSDKLVGDGILFYHGNELKQQMLYKMGTDLEDIQPTYVYVKYFSSSTTHAMFLMPSTPILYQFMENTTNFEWGEDFMLANETSMLLLGLNVGTNFLENEDYFFVEKLIVAQGYNVNGIEELKNLCGWSNQDTTTTTRETSPSRGCERPGYFSDPDDCASFRVCLYDAFGLFGDLQFHCPAPQVWCQQEQQCQIPQVCPCDG